MRIGRSVPLLACAVLSSVDAFLTLALPGFAPISSPVTLLVATFDTIVVAYCYGTWPGIVAACVATAFDGALIRMAAYNSVAEALNSGLDISLLGAQAAAGGLVGRLHELATRVRSQREQLEIRERHFRALTENAADLVLVLDETGACTYASPSHETALGYAPDDLLGMGYHHVLDPAGIAAVENSLNQALGDGAPPDRFDLIAHHRDGSKRMLEVLARDCFAEEAVDGLILSARDVTDRKHVEEKLAAQALHDALTGLPNRDHLAHRLEAELQDAAKPARPTALLFVDLERFRDVNDVLGHQCGDKLLVEASKRISNKLRTCDAAARIGGDEFAVLLSGYGAEEATSFAERIITSLRDPYQIAGQTVIIGATVGLAIGESGIEASSLLRHADVAMDSAKLSANGIAIYTSEDDERARRRLSIGSAIHEAIATDQLVLHYQPQISVADGSIYGVEALVRWDHPQRGMLRPDQFLPIVEEIGMMGRLTEWVLRAALLQMRQWRRKGIDLNMAINLSAQNLRDAHLAEAVMRLLALYEIPPERLCLELTETTVAAEGERAKQLLTQLSSLGIRISIDDFGTGYSSLLHLRRFPVNELKIDRTFVANMTTDKNDQAIVASTIELARRLNMDVVVEGIEQNDTYDAIAELGAQYAQGYLMSVPLPPAQLERWIMARNPKALAG